MPVYNLLSAPIKELRQKVYDAYQTDDIYLTKALLVDIYLGLNGEIDNSGLIAPNNK